MYKIVSMGLVTVIGSVLTLSAGEDTVHCEVLDDGVEKIQCTFVTPRKDREREVVFHWHSDEFPQDDREHTIMLPARNGSVYDYRYLWGRAEGMWTVTATLTEEDGSEREASRRFSLQGGKLAEAAH
ncbi:hypothetical protein WCX49_13110 [Sulfurimonas sp. HSL-1656]|uniref:hypothetical protein n=1 Tax=Thiomicrolovo subterrani TaxID=3131934 RepID=UPI0031FA1BB4